MSHDPLPVTTDDLLEALEIFLREEVTPQMQGYGEFRTRVALNILGMLRREQQHGGDHSKDISDLARSLRDGDTSWKDQQALQEIKAANLDRLRINNPKWILED
ncbi:MAG: hypothetical protein HN725_07720 [Alphaproteobacteria bacterium]|jgi:hypothetical protein|nr:hypothetical protein [Alphaproteobacteria bacterium]MBT4082748.1 hypothetical protein [Alphaproteobacteria bacterium]MBT4543977.1 hypothetical protein [Alphaproteobacteria bacterium]MBT6387766.1 hypothetical protein [Alphaproteobacteria bacterium]MBT7745164.1 hypothetical protein [Alphaproteobacteria bacterium]